MFNAQQKAALEAPLYQGHVKARSQSGRSLSYIEGWHAIAEANRIFGFDGWSSETIEMRLVAERSRKIGSGQKDGWGVSYVCKVRVRVLAGDEEIVREGIGAGHGIDVDLGLAHESAIKEAETDARKRALMTFGNPFGLALYDKTQANVSREDPTAHDEQEVIAEAIPAKKPDPQYRDPKVAAIERKEPPMPEKPLNETDSARIFTLAVATLDWCDTLEKLKGWAVTNGHRSDKWDLLIPEHKERLIHAAKTLWAELSAKELENAPAEEAA